MAHRGAVLAVAVAGMTQRPVIRPDLDARAGDQPVLIERVHRVIVEFIAPVALIVDRHMPMDGIATFAMALLLAREEAEIGQDEAGDAHMLPAVAGPALGV